MCDNCKYNITSEPFEGCIGCGRAAIRHGLCGSCKVPYSRAWVVDAYRGPVGEAIKGMKIVSMRETAKVLGMMLAETLPALPTGTILVPIPTLRSHIRQRGFDHTKMIAKSVSKHLQLPIEYPLQRVGRSMQRGSSAAQRRRQAKEAFIVEKQLDPEQIYLLVDDVVTTGATIREASARLRQAGAKEIWVAVLARETLD